MPAALVAKLAESTDIDIAEAEKRWNQAKAITTEEKGLTDKDGDAFWPYVTGVFKRSMGIGAVMEAASAEEIHAAAHEAATSHLNDLPQPTQAQLEAGNYRKSDPIYIHGLKIVIENPKGSTRSGVDPDGTPWECVIPAHYGDLKQTLGADGDAFDVYVGDHPESELVFVVDQISADTGKFDEHKGILGCLSQKEARDLYISGFSDGKGVKRLGAMTALHMPDFKKWLREGDTTKPLSDAVLESAEKAGQGQFFTLDEAREAAKRSPDYWKALMQDATTFDGIRGAFAAKWPEVVRAKAAAVKYRGMENLHPTAMAEVKRVLDQIVDDFGLPEIGANMGVEGRNNLGEASWGSFYLTKKYEHKTLDEINKGLPPDKKLGWVTAHETGHVIDHILKEATDQRGIKNQGYESAIRKIKATQGKDTSTTGGFITAYSLKNNSEYVAEHFADAVIRGDKASIYSKQVYAVLKEWYAKNKYKSFRESSEGYRRELEEERARKAAKLARSITKDNLPASGEIVEDKFGNEYLVMAARNSIVNVVPIVGGKAQVSSDTRISFNVDPGFLPASEQTRNQPLYTTGREYYAK